MIGSFAATEASPYALIPESHIGRDGKQVSGVFPGQVLRRAGDEGRPEFRKHFVVVEPFLQSLFCEPWSLRRQLEVGAPVCQNLRKINRVLEIMPERGNDPRHELIRLVNFARSFSTASEPVFSAISAVFAWAHAWK
jgi:hypothetical protein